MMRIFYIELALQIARLVANISNNIFLLFGISKGDTVVDSMKF